MRCFPALLLLASSFGLAAEDAPLDPRVQRILDDYREELVEAADDYREEVAEAREDAVRDLKRQVRSSTPLPERVAIMREVLRIAREDEEARAFFQTLGTLESELAALGGSPDQALAVDLLAPASNPAQGSLRALVEASPAAMALMASLESEPDAPIHADVELLKLGRSLAVGDARIHAPGAADRLFARATLTYSLPYG